MANDFTVDFWDLASVARSRRILGASDVLGPRERVIGSTNHEYRLTSSGIVLHVQNFLVVEPYRYSVVRRDSLTMQFTVSGAYRYGLGTNVYNVNRGSVRITGFPRSTSTVPASGSRLMGISLFIERSHLVDVFGLAVDQIPKAFRPLFTSRLASVPSIELPMSLTVLSAVRQIVECGFGEPLRDAYLSAKTVEVVCEVVAQLNGLRGADALLGVSVADRERLMIEAAAEIYRRELSRPPSVDEVARRVGVNRNKLSQGFRERFNTTPADYSRQERLHWAHGRLADGLLTVDQAAAATGYQSHAAFTRSFKEEFGHPPSKTAKTRVDF